MKDYSQYGEQKIILETLATLGIEKGHLVDLGAGDGVYLSNSRALLEMGWTGDLYDGDPKGAKDVQKKWITKSFCWTLGHGKCDFLTLDTDGNDYWFLSEFLKDTGAGDNPPSLIVCEINPIWQRDEAMVMPYNEQHVWDGTTYYGSSLAAYEKLLTPMGYTLMHLHHSLNAFFLRNDHAEAHHDLIRPIEYQVKVNHRPHTPEKKWQRL